VQERTNATEERLERMEALLAQLVGGLNGNGSGLADGQVPSDSRALESGRQGSGTTRMPSPAQPGPGLEPQAVEAELTAMPVTFGLAAPAVRVGSTRTSVIPGGTTMVMLPADETAVGPSPAVVASTTR
jgi:hypothetical protein